MITNQLKENIIQGWLLHIIRSFLQVSFRLQHQFINLAWISFDICSSPQTTFLWFCTHEMSFYYNYSHFQYAFCSQPVFICTTSKRSHDANPVFFDNNNKKDWTFSTLANPPPPYDSISFLPYPHLPSQWTYYPLENELIYFHGKTASIKTEEK